MGSNRSDVTRRAAIGSGVIFVAGCTGASFFDGADDDLELDLETEDGDDEVGTNNDNVADETGPERDTEQSETDADDEADHPSMGDVNPSYAGVFIDRGTTTDVIDEVEQWSGRGEIKSDDEYQFSGSHSLSYEGASGSIFRDYHNDPLDLSEADISIAGYFRHEVDGVDSFYVIAQAPDEENNITWRGRYLPDTAWQRLDLRPVETRGDPDLADIRKLEINGQHPDDETTLFNVDDFRTHQKPDRGKIVLLFEDCRVIHYEEYRHVLDEFDFPAAEAVHRNLVRDGHSGRMSNWQVQLLYDRGWDICTTTDRSPWEMSPEKLDRELREQHEWFDRYDITRGTNTFMYPHGKPQSSHLNVLADHFELAFAGRGQTTNFSLTNPLALPRFDTSNGLEETKAVIDRAAAHRSVAVLRFRDDFDRSELGELLEHVAAADDDLEVIAPTELAAHAWSVR